MLAFASTALGTGASRDTSAARKQLASARTFEKALRDLAPDAQSRVARQLAPCRAGFQPSGTEKQRRLNQLIALEGIRQLQHDGLADYETFAATALALRFSDGRLRTAQAAVALELEAARKLTRVPVTPCLDLRAFARGGYSADALTSWAKRIDTKAGVSEQDGTAADALVRKSRPALLAAGLAPANAKLVLDAETGDVFVAVFAR
jgi:hypothetical protein